MFLGSEMESGQTWDKHAISEEKRLASLRAKKEAYEQKQKIIADALKSVDDPNVKPKKIVFADSSDEEPSVCFLHN